MKNIKLLYILLIPLLVLSYQQLMAQTIDKNYITTYVPLNKYSDESAIPSLGATQCMKTVRYYDGLGRPDQTNLYKGSGDASKDIITSVGYDGFGREEKQYLPFASAKNGSYHTSVTSVSNFAIYDTPLGDDNYDDTYAYSQTVYEPSPLNRVKKQAMPGYNWRKGSNHEQKFEYGTNSAGEVEYFYVNSSGGLSKGTDYGAGTLYKNTLRDENNQTTSSTRTEEFTDKLGNIVLKKSWNGSTEHQTYYVYDDFNRLRFVLPPKAVADESVSSTELSQLCYQYKYDERGRLIEKKLPGAGWVYMIYDKRDRLVLTQDAKLRASGSNPNIDSKKYHYIKYDIFNRPVEQGISTETLSYTPGISSPLRNAVKRSRNYTPVGCSARSYTYYDDYSWGAPYGYSTVYTDHSKASSVKGLVTGVKTKVLGTSTWLTTVNYYDKYGRLIQQCQKNPDGGYNRTSTAYNFTNQPIKQQVYHKRTSGSAGKKTEEKYSYDHMGRPTRVEHSYNGGGFVTIAKNTYDEIGRLKKKELHNTYQDIDYTYNVRGWLTKINDPDAGYSSTKCFAEELYYNNTGELVNLDDKAQYNGNIAGIRWRNNSTKRAAYAFRYDGLNRLTKGDYGSRSSTGNVTNQSYYDVPTISYDKNGNISRLYRKTSGGGTRENLTYVYAGNQLSWISGTYKGGGISGKTFAYDANGNTKTDNLRGITVQYFDEIDLPKKYARGSQYAQYEYDAAGTKWSKKVVTSGTSTMEYYGNFVYQNGALDKVLTSEGYYQAGKYHYNLKDHLGNTRMVVSYSGSTPTVEQVIEYYPFGSMFSENNLAKNKYLYNGKELQNEFFENYDYGARFYDPELGRWHSVDPLSEWDFARSPYAYVTNNPLRYIDPDGNFRTKFGAWLWKTFNGGGQTLQDQRSGEYFVSQRIEDSNGDDQVDVTVKRVFRGQKRYSNSSSRGYTQKGGIPFVTSGQSISPTKARAKYTDRPVNIDDLMPAIGGAEAGRFQRSPLDFAQGIGKIMDISSLNKDQNTSDKKILEEHGGSQKQKTGAQGVVFGTGKYSTWKKTKSLVGSSYEDATGDSVLYINHKGDSTLYIDITEQEGPGFEWRVKSPLK
nr:DUF6443 domain-containing protein [uncultured Draconibacterium sp.]